MARKAKISSINILMVGLWKNGDVIPKLFLFLPNVNFYDSFSKDSPYFCPEFKRKSCLPSYTFIVAQVSVGSENLKNVTSTHEIELTRKLLKWIIKHT